jgi:hypothetical protein
MPPRFQLTSKDFATSLTRYFSLQEIKKLKNVGQACMSRGETSLLDWSSSSRIVERFKLFGTGVCYNSVSEEVVIDSLTRSFALTKDEASSYICYATSDKDWSLCIAPCLLCGSFQMASKQKDMEIDASVEQRGDVYYRHCKLVQHQLHFMKTEDLIDIFLGILDTEGTVTANLQGISAKAPPPPPAEVLSFGEPTSKRRKADSILMAREQLMDSEFIDTTFSVDTYERKRSSSFAEKFYNPISPLYEPNPDDNMSGFQDTTDYDYERMDNNGFIPAKPLLPLTVADDEIVTFITEEDVSE